MEKTHTDQLTFLDEWTASINRSGTPEDQKFEELAAIEFASEIDDREAQLAALGGLLNNVHFSRDRVQNILGELKYGSRTIIEATVSDIPLAVERLLNSNNAAFVIRNGQYEDFSRDVLGNIQAHNGLHVVESQEFPLASMGNASSELHLDNFIDSNRPGFRYAISAARVEQGQVLFVAGLASPKARNWNRIKYFDEVKKINEEPAVKRIFDQAKSGTNPSYREFSLDREHVNLGAVLLLPGDVVAWPQGWPQSEVPAWHAIREVGNPQNPGYEPRKTTSYHMSI
jgi:hypothetical protein